MAATHAGKHDADAHAQEFVPGSMDIAEQVRTFHGFLRLLVRAVVVIFAILILLALVNA